MSHPIFENLDSIVKNCESLIKEYQLLEQKIDKPQSSIFSIFRIKLWKLNYEKLKYMALKIDTELNILIEFYDSNKNRFSNDINSYVREYIKYFDSVLYAVNLRKKIQKDIVDDLIRNFMREEDYMLNSHPEDLVEMTVALENCEKNSFSVNEIVERIRSNNERRI